MGIKFFTKFITLWIQHTCRSCFKKRSTLSSTLNTSVFLFNPFTFSRRCFRPTVRPDNDLQWWKGSFSVLSCSLESSDFPLFCPYVYCKCRSEVTMRSPSFPHWSADRQSDELMIERQKQAMNFQTVKYSNMLPSFLSPSKKSEHFSPRCYSNLLLCKWEL